jgi:glycerol uptake facilitator-like aquaporin
MRAFIKQLVGDGRGGADEQALISLVGAGVFFGLQIYAVVARGQAFEPIAFGTGFGTLLGATAAGFGLRTHLTPNQSL